MELFIEKENVTKEISLEQPTPLKEIVKKEGISLESVILIKNDSICLEEELICDEDKVKLLSVVSGG